MKAFNYLIALVATLVLWCLLIAAGLLWSYWITALGFILWGFIALTLNPPWRPKGRWK